MGYFLLALLTLFTLTVIVNIFRSVSAYKNIEYNKLRSAEYIAMINYNITEEDFNLLDRFIGECFDEYRALNLEYKQVEYITEEDEMTISKEFPKMVIDRMSKNFVNKLSIIYNTSPDRLGDIILSRCRLTILLYVISKNSIKNNDNKEE